MVRFTKLRPGATVLVGRRCRAAHSSAPRFGLYSTPESLRQRQIAKRIHGKAAALSYRNGISRKKWQRHPAAVFWFVQIVSNSLGKISSCSKSVLWVAPSRDSAELAEDPCVEAGAPFLRSSALRLISFLRVFVPCGFKLKPPGSLNLALTSQGRTLKTTRNQAQSKRIKANRAKNEKFQKPDFPTREPGLFSVSSVCFRGMVINTVRWDFSKLHPVPRSLSSRLFTIFLRFRWHL